MVIAGVILFILFFLRPWVQVGAGQRGIVLNFDAVQEQVMDEGLHLTSNTPR
jgi:regulator of protease activity HflC (stomatin/prohibitin superfamily)